MTLKYNQGIYQVRHPDKYVGPRAPTYRSGWEFTFMSFCDNNPSVLQWASEPLKIPYRNPLNGKHTVYVPDFLIVYMDRNQKKHAELIEIKPSNQTILEKVGKNPYNQAQYVKNQAKWAAANNWCKNNNIRFRIVSENDIFMGTGKRDK